MFLLVLVYPHVFLLLAYPHARAQSQEAMRKNNEEWEEKLKEGTSDTVKVCVRPHTRPLDSELVPPCPPVGLHDLSMPTRAA